MGVPQLHQREHSLPTSFPSIKAYQRQDTMLRLAALFLLVSAWCLTSEAGLFGGLFRSCADWTDERDCYRGIVYSMRMPKSFAVYKCRKIRDECEKKMSDEAENSVSGENEPASAMEDEGKAAAMEDWNGSCMA